MDPENVAAETDTIRDSIDAAFDKVESTPAPDAAPDKAPDPEKTLPPAPERVPAPALERAPDKTPAAEKAPPTEKVIAGAPPVPGKAADKAPAAPLTPEAALAAAEKKLAEARASRTAGEVRAPQSWKPEVREKFNALPPEVQAEISRREREISVGLQEAARSRQAVEAMQGVLAPYAPAIKAMGGNAVQVIEGFFQYDNALRHGSHAQKAQAVANLVRNYGVSIEALDSALAGQPVSEAAPASAIPPNLQAIIQEQIAPFQQIAQRFQEQEQMRSQEVVSTAVTDVEKFAAGPDGKGREFYEDVRETMADLMELAAQRKQHLPLEKAYEQALLIHPEVSSIIINRRLIEQARTVGGQAAAAQAAMTRRGGAGAPVGSGRPASGAAGGKDSIRDDLMAALETVSTR